MVSHRSLARVLVVAGSDSGGGAGIQADLKTVMALGGYATTAITALTAQNTERVAAIHAVPPEFVRRQIMLALGDIGADAVKTGMLYSADVIEVVAHTLKAGAKHVPLVLDPVLVAKGGAELLHADAVKILKTELLPMAAVVTPNIPEAELLAGMSIRSPGDMCAAAKNILALGAEAVLIKGGHLEGDTVHDLLVDAKNMHPFESPRIGTRHTHGTGCTLASSIAVGLAQGMTLRDAVTRGRNYVMAAIRTAPGLGGGHGPLNHMA